MKRYVVVAKFHHRESDGENHQGDTMYKNYFEERAYTFTADQPISAIFDKISRNMGIDPIDLRLFNDQSNYGDQTHTEIDPDY